ENSGSISRNNSHPAGIFMKLDRFALLLMTCVMFACSSDDEQNPDTDQVPQITLKLADPLATAETRALYSNLWKIQATGFMFGHHDDLIYGRDWTQEPGGSDVKEVCGDYPAVFSVDFAEIMDDRH